MFTFLAIESHTYQLRIAATCSNKKFGGSLLALNTTNVKTLVERTQPDFNFFSKKNGAK